MFTMTDSQPCGWPDEDGGDLRRCSAPALWKITHENQPGVGGLVCGPHADEARGEDPAWIFELLAPVHLIEVAERAAEWVAFCSCGWESTPRRWALPALAEAWAHMPSQPAIALGRLEPDDVAQLLRGAQQLADEHRARGILAPDPDVVVVAALSQTTEFRIDMRDLRHDELAALRQLLWSAYWTRRGEQAPSGTVVVDQ